MSSHNERKVILITGCSQGIGLLTAVQLAKTHTVYATMRSLNKADLLNNALANVDCNVRLLPLDITNLESINQAVEIIYQEQGRLDVLINNAGYMEIGFWEMLTLDKIREQFETNFFGTIAVTKAVLPQMRAQSYGHIINISSMTGFSTMPAAGAYCSSKWAMEGFSESLRLEMAPLNVQVHLIQPGTFKTNMFNVANDGYEKLVENSPYQELGKILKKNMFNNFYKKFLSDPQRIAHLINKIVDNPRCKFRHIIGFDSYFFYYLRKALPFMLYQFFFMKLFYRGLK